MGDEAMKPRALLPSAAVAALLLLSAGRASAQIDVLDAWPRVWEGFGAGGGLFIVPGVRTLGLFGPHVQFGAQLSSHWGLFGEADIDFVAGELSGIYAASAFLAELAYPDDYGIPRVSISVGPELGFYELG